MLWVNKRGREKKKKYYFDIEGEKKKTIYQLSRLREANSLQEQLCCQWSCASKDSGPLCAFPRQSNCLCHSEQKTFSNMNTLGCSILARMENASSRCGSWPLSLCLSVRLSLSFSWKKKQKPKKLKVKQFPQVKSASNRIHYLFFKSRNDFSLHPRWEVKKRKPIWKFVTVGRTVALQPLPG